MFARYAEIMPYYTTKQNPSAKVKFARYAEIMPYYTIITLLIRNVSLLGMLK